MIELGAVRPHLLKRVLPFALTLALGSALGSAVRLFGGKCRTDSSSLRYAAMRLRLRPDSGWREAEGVQDTSRSLAPAPRELPELHILSPMLMTEVREFELRGGGYEAARVTSPAGSQYTAARRENYAQGVLQLSFLFGADGRVSEITPLVRRHDCGLCLRGPRVVGIDPRAARWVEQVKAAKEAVRRIEFVPGTNGGRPVEMHGLAECVFRLE